MKTLQMILDEELVATVTIVPRTSTPSTCRHRHRQGSGQTLGPGKKLWLVKYGKIAGTPLKKHIQADDLSFSEQLTKPST